MFGPFDRKSNVMFHDETETLKGIVELEKDRMPRLLEPTLRHYNVAEAQRLLLKNSGTTQRLGLMYPIIGIFMLAHYF